MLNFPRTKAIKGIMMDQYPDLFKVADWNERFIGEWVRKIDKHAPPEVPVPRRDGIALATTEQRLTSMEQNMLLSVRLNPARTDHDETYFDICTDRSENFAVVRDWELEQAKRVAYAQGSAPIGDDQLVFYTDAEIRRRYDAYVARHPECAAVTTQDMDYPVSIIDERIRDANIRTAISRQTTSVKRIRISSDYVPTRSQPRSHRVTERSVQHRRAKPVEVSYESVGSSGGAAATLEKAGVRVARKN
jgi:hypothetical protein